MSGPVRLVFGIIYRLVEGCWRKHRYNAFMDFENSNYFHRPEASSTDDDSYTAAAPPMRFNWKNFFIVTVSQGLTAALSLFVVAFVFKFAL